MSSSRTARGPAPAADADADLDAALDRACADLSGDPRWQRIWRLLLTPRDDEEVQPTSTTDD
jgi:hypothetical protein